MAKKFLLAMIFLFLLQECSEKSHSQKIPVEINKKIREFELTVCQDGKVFSYTFRGEKVFVFDASACCCDQTSEITDIKGKTICYLGGIQGNRICNGTDFYKNAIDRTLIWQKEKTVKP